MTIAAPAPRPVHRKTLAYLDEEFAIELIQIGQRP